MMGQIAENINLWEVYKDRNESSPISESRIGSSSGIKLKKGPWTAEEDDILVDYVMKHGEGNWNNVQKSTGLLRSGKSCRLRWMNQLRPDLKKGAFSKEEENLIIDLHATMGNKWALISEHLPGRTDNEIKNFWNTRIKRHKRAGLPLYPPRLHCQELPRTPQAHEQCAPITGSKRHHPTVPAINCNTPGAMYGDFKFNEEHSPHHHNMSATGKQMADAGGFHHISLHLPANSRHTSLQESPKWFLDAELSPTNLAQNFEKASCPANLTPMHYSPASKIKLKTTYLELPSIQTLDVHPGFGDYYHLACSSLESYDAFPNSLSPVGNILPQVPSENRLLENVLPDTNASSASIGLSPVASSTSSTATPSYMQANSGFNLGEMEPKNPVSPILSFGPPMLPSFPDYIPSSSTSGTLKVEQSADCVLPAGHNESSEEAPLGEADVDELSDWLNLSSSPGESLTLEYDCQDPISTAVGNAPGQVPASDAWNNMPSICQMPELG